MTVRHAAPSGSQLAIMSPADAELSLSGDWIAREAGMRDVGGVCESLAQKGGAIRLRLHT